MNSDKVSKNYERLKTLLKDADATKLSICDGLILEAAREKTQLDELNDIAKNTGLVKIHPTDPSMQKPLPIATELSKLRASYTNTIDKLVRNLCGAEQDDDNGLGEFE